MPGWLAALGTFNPGPVISNVELNRIAKRSAERILENGLSLRWCYTGTEAKTCNLR